MEVHTAYTLAGHRQTITMNVTGVNKHLRSLLESTSIQSVILSPHTQIYPLSSLYTYINNDKQSSNLRILSAIHTV